MVAGVNGTWRANDAAEVWGENYAACKLPTYTLNGEQVQMASFSGYKLIGVNPHSANVGAAMLLADFVTNEENEGLRFQERAQGPSNINALAAASSPLTCSALAATSGLPLRPSVPSASTATPMARTPRLWSMTLLPVSPLLSPSNLCFYL